MSESEASWTSKGSGSSAAQDPERMNKPGEDDLDEAASLLQGVFGVLYVVSKEQERASWRFVAFRLLADVLQLFLLIVSPTYGWDINGDDPGWKAVSFIGLNWIISSRGYSFFLAILYIMVVAMCLVVALCVWVGWSFKNSRFDYVWPITVLRWYGRIFFQVLDIASMSLFLIAMDCGYFGVANQYYNQEFPDQACFQMPHLIHLVVAAVSLLGFIAMALTYQVADMELNPLSKNLIAMGHSKADVQGFLLRAVMTVANVFVTDTRWLSILYLLSSVVLVYLYYKWIPHLHAWVNHVRVGSYAAIAWCSLLFVIVAFARGDDDSAVNQRSQATIAMYAGVLPAACLGALASWWRTRFFMVTVLNKFKAADPGTKTHLIYRFTDPREAEILVRCCRVWSPIDPELVEPDAVALAERIIKVGLEQMAKAPYMIILHSSFLIDVQSSYQSGYTQLQTAKRMDPSFLERFAIFSREQQHTQQASGADNGNVNLVSYVEFQKNYRLVLKSHKEALIALRQFWQHLMHDNTRLLNLTRDVQRIDQSIRQAEAVYKMILTRHAANVKILRLYARFLEGVKHDPWSAAKWFSEAEKLEQAEEDAKNGNLLSELGLDLTHAAGAEGLKDLGALLSSKGGILGTHDTRAVLIINAQCVIQVTNPTVQKVFGWTKTEIKGKNINVIIPPPFADMHTQFVRSHVMSGKENVIGHANEFVALHKDRHIVPVSLSVTKISGIGEDMLFMGILEPLPVEPNVAHAWVMLGSQAVVSVDPCFTDFFGFKSEELLGAQLDDWLVATEAARSVINMERADTAAVTARFASKPPAPPHQKTSKVAERLGEGEMSGEAHTATQPEYVPRTHTIRSLQVRHRYSDPLVIDATITPGWVGSHRYLQFKMIQRGGAAMTAICDRHGKLVHVTESLASALGTSPRQLMQNGAPGALQAMMPQVFATLHNAYISQGTPVSLPPLHSCRSGLPVLLMDNKPSGPPAPKAFRISITKKEGDLNLGDLHIVNFTALTLDQALADRRWKLVLDSNGRCVHVLSGDDSVFGFSPTELLGAALGDFIDAFKGQYIRQDPANIMHKKPAPPPGHRLLAGQADSVMSLLPMKPSLLSRPGTQAGGSGSEGGAADDDGSSPRPRPPSAPVPPSPAPPPPDPLFRAETDLSALDMALMEDIAGAGSLPGKAMEKVLLILAAKAHRSPRTSLRVGVVRPPGDQDSGPGAGLEGLLGHVVTRPAIMTVSVKAISNKEAGGRNGRLLVQTLSKRVAQQSAGQAAGAASAGGAGTSEEDVISMMLAKGGGGLAFVIELWRSDLVTGVVELDSNGVVTHSTALPLYPPGLLFGVPESQLLGAHISTLLPQVTTATPLAALFEPGFGGYLAPVSVTDALRKRSNLKMMERGGGGKRLPGPVNVMMTVHKMDQEGLEVAVQAVHKLGPGAPGGVYLVMRPVHPACGRADLCQFLITAQQEEAAAAEALAAAARNRRSSALSMSGAAALMGGAPGEADHMSPLSLALPKPSGHKHGPARRASSRALITKGTNGGAVLSILPSPPALVQDILLRQGTSNLPQPHAAGPRTPLSPGGHPSPLQPGAAEGAELAHNMSQNLSGRPANNSGMPADRLTQWVSSLTDDSAEQRTPPHGAEGGGAHPPEAAGASSEVSPVHTSDHEDPLEAALYLRPDRLGKGNVGEEERDDDDEDEEEESSEAPSSPRPHHRHGDGDDHGGEHSASDSEVLEPGAEAGNYVAETDYKRGARFKKLQRMLLSPLAQRRVERFRIHAYSVILFTLAVNLGLFILQIMLIDEQKSGVNDLYSVGTAARVGIRTANLMRPMDVLYSGRGLPTLPGLTNVSTDMPAIKDQLDRYSNQMQYLHQGVYLGFNKHRQLPEDYGLRDLWENPTLTERVYEDTVPVTAYTRLASLWDVGNRFVARLDNIWQISDLVVLATNQSFWNWAEVQYVVNNGPSVMTPAYYTTMDDFLSIAVDNAHSINRIQLIVLILEGMFVGVLSLSYMWLMAAQVMWQRYTIFNVFIVIPVGIVRALSTTPIVLDEEDEEDTDALAEMAGATAAPAAGKGDGSKAEGKGDTRDAVIKLHLDPSLLGPGGGGKDMGLGPGTLYRRLGRALGFAMLPPHVEGKSRQRRLTTSLIFILWLTWPFMLWAVVNIVLNVSAYQSLTTADSPIAVFNLVNSAAARFQRTLFYAQELCTSTDPKYHESVRTTLAARYSSLKQDWDAMLYGGSVINSTLPRYTLAQTGMIAAGGPGDDILFNYQGCLRFNQSGCMDQGDVFYQWTSNGLDRLMHFYFDLVEQMVNASAGPYPTIDGWEFQFLWRAREDMQDGMQRACDAFYQTVNDVYSFSYSLLIAKFALSVVISLSIYIFILRPFLAGLRNEARRVAELLCQLPPDIAVEDMVGRAMGLLPPTGSSAAQQPATDSISAVASKSFTGYGRGGGAGLPGQQASFVKDGLSGKL